MATQLSLLNFTSPQPIQFSTPDLVRTWLQTLDARACSPKTIRNYAAWGQRLATKWPTMTESDFPECIQIASASLHRQGYSPTSIHGFQCSMASMAFCCWGWEPERRQAMITARPVKPVHTVPNVDQVKALTAAMPEPYRTVALLCYCCGLRISEAIQVRLQDIDLLNNTLAVMLSKGAKGRTVPIPSGLVSVLRNQAAKAIGVCESDLAQGSIYAPLSGFEYLKHPSRGQEPGQWPLFPQTRLVRDRRVKGFVRVFVHSSKVERAFADARKRTGSAAHITPHRLRDAFAVHSLINGVPVNVIQNLMGHATLETTAKYLSYLLTDEGAKLFPGLDLYKHLESA